MKKRVMLMAAAVIMAAGLTGCSGSPAKEQQDTTQAAQSTTGQESRETKETATEPEKKSGEKTELTITWWGSQQRAELTQEALSLYEGENPGVTFDGQFLSGADYWNKLATSAAGHTMADVVQMDKAYIKQYVDNGMLVDLQPYVDSGVINLKKEAQRAEQYVDSLSIKTPDIEFRVRNLSGGNQQKVVIGRWMCCDSDIFIFDEPTVGVDVGAKVEIYKLIEGLIADGKAVILISSYLPEVMGLSDRLMVMYEGKQTGIIERDEFYNADGKLREDFVLGMAAGIKQE